MTVFNCNFFCCGCICLKVATDSKEFFEKIMNYVNLGIVHISNSCLLVTVVYWMLGNFTNTWFFIVLINNHNQSHPCHLTTASSPLPPRLSQNKDNNNTMELKSILSLQVLNTNDEEPVFIKTMAAFLAVLVDVEAMSRLTFLTVSSTHAALPWGPWAARIFSREHILNSDGAEIPAAYRQQVWGQGRLSKDVKSMKDSLMSFPLPLQTKGLECRRMPVDMLQMEEIRSSE